MFEFHVSRISRDNYEFDQSLFKFDGNVILANFLAAREFAQKINRKKNLVNFPEQAVKAGEINALGLIDEILHLVVQLYRQSINPRVMVEAYAEIETRIKSHTLDSTLIRFTEEFPPLSMYRGEMNANAYLSANTAGTENKILSLEELLMLWITNQNPATEPFSELFTDTNLMSTTAYRQVISDLSDYFKNQRSFGPDNQDLITMLRSPAIAEPNSLSGQLEYIRRKWGYLIGDYLYRLLGSIDLIKEETKLIFTGPGPTQIVQFDAIQKEEENFSPDSDWMPNTVMIAKNSYVWLYQLSQTYQREIKRLDQIPDEELDKLATWGFNGLWLIGLWERSEASKRIKQLCGYPEAVASAYSLKNYRIAEALGGEQAYQNLRDRAWRRGIRLASDMVPNHMGIDSDWVIDHPDWFISLPYSPYPAYSFSGPNLSPVAHVGIFLEDHYYDRTDAAVVFMRVNNQTGETRFVYHGNDGTSMPWNDTAQLNYLNAEVRESVIQTILHVARKFSIIRFDAAMTLAKKHYQRLWFPQPGSGGAIPSRAEHSLSREEFDRVFPNEFWREVVDRVAEEVPDTLLLAEAFWLMEGYFVRTLGMHRVYNSAFMNMLRNEENSKYRQVIKNTLEFDPDILKRYVNFMNNPDEKTAVEQFGKGDKYFGICTLMVTMPGLPMFGHGQIEGYAEKYGMEYFRPYWDEEPDLYLVDRHQREIFPLLEQRGLFSGIEHFLLYDFYTDTHQVNEDVFAYSNGSGGSRALVIYNNKFSSTQGWIHSSVGFLNKTQGRIESRLLHEGLNLSSEPGRFIIFKDNASNLEYIRRSDEIRQSGLYFELNAYEHHVFTEFREVEDNVYGQFAQLTKYLNGGGVPSIEEALQELMLSPIFNPFKALVNSEHLQALYQARLQSKHSKLDAALMWEHEEKFLQFLTSITQHVNGHGELQTIVRENQRGLDAILKLNFFDDHFPFPGSKKYEQSIKFIKEGIGQKPVTWLTLILWNDLRLLGQVVTADEGSAAISRSWLDEWGLIRVGRTVLAQLGMNNEESFRAETILRLLIQHQNWVFSLPENTTYSLVETWFTEEEIRTFLNVNRYRDILWFNQEAFEEMMWWMMTVALIRLSSDQNINFAELVERLFDAYELIEKVLKAEKTSEYQVEKLLEGLK
jgi:glycosidase